jgi:amidase
MAPPSKKQKLERSWQEIAKEAQEHRDASLAQVKPGLPDLFDAFEENLESVQSNPLKGVAIKLPGNVLHPRDVKITGLLPENLIKELAVGDLSATDVATAFLRRAVIAQKLVSVEFTRVET